MKNPPVVRQLEIRYHYLDPYGHVNNAVYLEFYEALRMAYWRELARALGIEEKMVAGDIPGARYVIAETSIRYKAPIFLEDTLFGAVSVREIGNRSYTMDFELRTGESFEAGKLVSESYAAHVFFDPEADEVRPRPEWFLATVAGLEGRPQKSFLREKTERRGP